MVPVNFEFSDARVGCENVASQFVKNRLLRRIFLHFRIVVIITNVVTHTNKFLKINILKNMAAARGYIKIINLSSIGASDENYGNSNDIRDWNPVRSGPKLSKNSSFLT